MLNIDYRNAAAIWPEFAKETDGVYQPGEPGAIVYHFKYWKVKLDTHVPPPTNNQVPRPVTRMRALFISKDDFNFKIYREIENLFSSTLKFFRLLKDVEIGDPEFDNLFIMRGTDEQKISRLFSDKNMQALMMAAPENGILQIIDDDPNIFKRKLPEGVDILSWWQRGLVEDKAELKSILDLFLYVLTQLVTLDVAEERSSDAKLPD